MVSRWLGREVIKSRIEAQDGKTKEYTGAAHRGGLELAGISWKMAYFQPAKWMNHDEAS